MCPVCEFHALCGVVCAASVFTFRLLHSSNAAEVLHGFFESSSTAQTFGALYLRLTADWLLCIGLHIESLKILSFLWKPSVFFLHESYHPPTQDSYTSTPSVASCMLGPVSLRRGAGGLGALDINQYCILLQGAQCCGCRGFWEGDFSCWGGRGYPSYMPPHNVM